MVGLFAKKSIDLAALLASLAFWIVAAPLAATAFSSSPTFLSRFQVLGKNKSYSIQLFSNKGFSDDRDDDAESSSFDMDELRARMDQQMNQYIDLLTLNENVDQVNPEHVYIVIFNPDSDTEQGVHTIQFPKGSNQNILLAFESDDECVEFAEMLKNMQFYNPIPQMANLGELKAFCGGMGLPVKVVPQGKGLRPPADNVKELGMNPILQQEKEKLRRSFMVSDDEKDDDSGDLNSAWE